MLLVPERASGAGVVVLAGSSGRVDEGRAALFAELGATVLAQRWFGGPGQAPGICEIPLETFFMATDHLVALGCRRIVYVGTSKGAEAALLVAAHDARVDTVVALSPSSVVWGNVGAGLDGVSWPERSSWTLQGKPLPFVPADPAWEKQFRGDLVTYRSLFEHCLNRFTDSVEAATIPVERAAAQIVLVAGGDDALWPSDVFARAVQERLNRFGKEATVVLEPDAGHRVLLPGENTARSKLHAHGGSDEADARLGEQAWGVVADLL